MLGYGASIVLIGEQRNIYFFKLIVYLCDLRDKSLTGILWPLFSQHAERKRAEEP
jgi:hypothetical protein